MGWLLAFPALAQRLSVSYPQQPLSLVARDLARLCGWDYPYLRCDPTIDLVLQDATPREALEQLLKSAGVKLVQVENCLAMVQLDDPFLLNPQLINPCENICWCAPGGPTQR